MKNWKNNKNSPRFVDYSFLVPPLAVSSSPFPLTPLILPPTQEKEPLYNH